MTKVNSILKENKLIMNINDKDYEEISITTIVTPYTSIFTGILYENIHEWLNSHCNKEVTLNKK